MSAHNKLRRTLTSIGAQVCLATTAWQRKRPELRCFISQRVDQVSLAFQNTRKQTITEMQVSEISSHIEKLVNTLQLRIVRTLSGSEGYALVKIEYVLTKE